ncbi:hypothetical protein ACFLWR_00585 [Chloroflexota bacterium]
MKLKEILNICVMDELRSLARECLLPIGDDKNDVITILIQAYPPNQPSSVLEKMKVTTLTKICKACELPATNTKGRLINRIWEIIDVPTWNNETRTKCPLCGRMRDRRMITKHHFIPKAVALHIYKYEGGVIQTCANCHNVYHRNEDEFKANNKGELLTYENITRLFNKTRREILSGTYGHM